MTNRKIWTLLSLLTVLFGVSGCATLLPLPDEMASVLLDEKVEKVLDRFCPISADPKNVTFDDRVIRSYAVLAAVVGHGYRTLENYGFSKEDSKFFAEKIVSKIKPSLELIKKMDDEKSAYFFLPHGDVVVELSKVALASIEPSIKIGKKPADLLLSSNREQAAGLLIQILEDKLYFDAFHNSCYCYANTGKKAETIPMTCPTTATDMKAKFKERITDRCEKLKGFFDNNSTNYECEVK
ncbi:MAG: hypothetical protein HQL56_00465 [Magnetococcales bacterium]|nr:hypothetical protein [Magnetococcales bacterium]